MASQARPSGGAKVEASNVSARMRKDWFVCVAMVTHARGTAKTAWTKLFAVPRAWVTIAIYRCFNTVQDVKHLRLSLKKHLPCSCGDGHPCARRCSFATRLTRARSSTLSTAALPYNGLLTSNGVPAARRLARVARTRSRCHRFPEYDDEILQVEGPFFSSPTQKQVFSVPPEGRQNDRSFLRPSDKKSAQRKDWASRIVENASSGSATMTFRTFWLGKDPKSCPPAGHSRVRR